MNNLSAIPLATTRFPCKELADAHRALDRAVDRLYQRKPFASDADRVALLFKRYQEITNG